ncbi:transmembrane protein 230-like [Iris pallida]|uniref:Transmembrane protein 230 n=1 Tax=Iris pallida TaxID=29817 RepID=A0AAX6FH94_IRIPA|nr:putative pentatricopeptide repeat-containing protein, mitochondrial [Iris pallida]KAJ6819029.1 putative receptor-like protein kinase [Iris pallida]KAJ6854072.1 transmembrane protein 230-like [Iris pallida]
MAYVVHSFSITDEDMMVDEPSYAIHSRPPVKEIALAVSLLVVGILSIVVGILMAYNHVGGDATHGIFFAILGSLLFLPGFYYTRIAYYAYKGYKGFSFANIPTM